MEFIKVIDFGFGEVEEIFIVQAGVVEPVTDGALSLSAFELLEELGGIEFGHRGAVGGDDWAEVEEFLKALTRTAGSSDRFGDNF